ncbi:Gamma-glutamylputrescine oxidoreductase [Bacillus paralicheniformis]|nr:FAD-dependent oxidoreductase [Bacillus sonorensis]NWN80668.1 FAD-dependent oxidoreductase [Bacillus sp. (in: firmicutes)]TWK72738.1 Gamma-glutamylputrescine oxidoreductase [Bacillus paralicheniformis]
MNISGLENLRENRTGGNEVTNNEQKLPDSPESFWRDSTELPSFQELTEDVKTDVAIIGGGMTGITTAYMLTQKGYSVVLIEAGRLLNGTTGHTTAKITAQHDLIYDELIQHIGMPRARLYYEANLQALSFIKNLVHEQNISCDFKEQDACIYTTEEQSVQKIRKEHEAYQKLGIERELIKDLPVAIDIKAGLVMKNQAQFHPLHYLKHLADAVQKAGGNMFENTVAKEIKEGDHPKVLTKNGHMIISDYVVCCTHFPFHDKKGFYFARLEPSRSYVLAVKPKTPYPDGMYLSIDQPSRSLRSVTINGEKMVLVGGESHKTGQGKDTMEHYKALESFAEGVLGIEDIPYRWSTQDLITLDKIPYIGPIYPKEKRILVATGFRKWGMTSSTLAAQLITDHITNESNPYQEVFSPSRFHPDPSIKKAISYNTDVARHFVEGKLEQPLRTPDELVSGEGAVVRVGGKRAGAYRDENGQLHMVDTTCTHMGCEVEWNDGEKTWDCPCHGSRFSIDGEVIEGPAVMPLKDPES